MPVVGRGASLSRKLVEFSIESDTPEHNREAIEHTLLRDMERSRFAFDGEKSDSDNEFLPEIESLLLKDDTGPPSSRALEEATKELEGMDSTVSSLVESIELGRGATDFGLTAEFSPLNSRKMSQRTSPGLDGEIYSLDSSPKFQRHTSRSMKTSKNMSPLNVITERSLLDVNKSYSPTTERHSVDDIPTSFKNQDDFLTSLGIGNLLKNNENENMKMGGLKVEKTRGANRRVRSSNEYRKSSDIENIKLPDMTGITSLLSNDTTTDFSKHQNIRSIAVSEDDRAILSALRSMQERIQQLETKNATYRTAVVSLESELNQTRQDFLKSKEAIRSLEHQLEQKKREMIGAINSADKERIQKALEKERQGWNEKQKALKSRIESLQRDLSLQLVKYQRVEEERNEAVKALSEAMDEIAELRNSNAKLRLQLNTISKAEKLSAKQRVQENESMRKEKILTNEDGTLSTREDSHDSEPSYTLPRKSKNGRKMQKNVSSTNVKVKSKNKESKKPTLRRRNHSIYVETDYEDGEDTTTMSEDYEPEDESDLEDSEEYSESEVTKSRNLRKSRSTHAANQSRTTKRTDNADLLDILPKLNITMKKVMDQISQHNPTACTVCSRRRSKKQHQSTPLQTPDNVPIRSIVNPMKSDLWEEEDTMRPSMAPQTAVNGVLTQLEDEFKHLKLQYHSLVEKYECLNPGLGKRKRKSLVSRLKEIIEELEGKADQIYALYDVLQSQGEGILSKHSATGVRPIDGAGNLGDYSSRHDAIDDDCTRNLLGKHSWINV
ncbi:centrosome microtubule-binding domain of Cep57-domain-containing protein [Dipodascopsis uninucleata]